MSKVINPNKYGKISYTVLPTGVTVIGETKTYQTYDAMLRDSNPAKICIVLDASADPTVNQGKAVYVYEGNKFIKWYETEAMDLDTTELNSIFERKIAEAIEDGRIVTQEAITPVVVSIVEQGGFTKLAITPFVFGIDRLKKQTENCYSINIPGFVFMLEDESHTLVIVKLQRKSDGSTDVVFEDITANDIRDAGAFTAYALTTSDGEIIPTRNPVYL